MPFKIEINTTRLSLRLLGMAALAIGGLLGLIGLFRRVLLLPALLFAGLGLALYGRKYEFLLRHQKGAVAEQLIKTLLLMNWKHSQEHDMISVPAVKALVTLRSLGSATLVQFSFAGEVGKPQDFLVNAIVKFQRHTK